MTWATVAAVAALCVSLRLASPLALRGRRLPALPERVLAAAVTPALAGLVLFQLCGSGQGGQRGGGVNVLPAATRWRR